MARQKPVVASPPATRKQPWWSSTTLLTILALLILPPTLATYTLVQSPSLRSLVLIYALAVNAGTFLTYRRDKRAAAAAAAAARDGTARRWRESEVNLHLWALAGGWPAAFVAQQVLRHKTRKARFLAVFWVLVVGEELFLCLKILGR